MSSEASLSLGLAAAVGFTYFTWRTQIQRNSLSLRSHSRPSDVTWLTESGYQVVVAICDTFIPELSPEEISLGALRDALQKLCPEILDQVVITEQDLRTHQGHLRRGAVQSNIPNLFVKIFQDKLQPVDKKKISGLLSALATSAGCAVLSGFPAPFQVSWKEPPSLVWL